MELVTVILLINMVSPQFAGARLLKSDFQRTDSKFTTLPRGSQTTNDGVGGVIRLRPSTGVDQMIKTDEERPVQPMSMSKLSAINILPLGSSPAGGRQGTDGLTERVQMSSTTSEKSKKSTFNKLPSGPSPGVGHSFINGNVEKIEALSQPHKQSTFNKLPPGPSPGVGHEYTNGHIQQTQTRIFARGQLSTKIEPQSGPSPGVGHTQTNSHNEKSTTSDSETEAAFSGPSNGVGHSIPTVVEGKFNSHHPVGHSISAIETIENKAFSGSSDGVGRAVISNLRK